MGTKKKRLYRGITYTQNKIWLWPLAPAVSLDPADRLFRREVHGPRPRQHFSGPGRLSALLERFSLSTVRGSGQCCPAAPGPGSGFVLTLGRDPVYLLAVACPCPTPRVGQDRVYLLGGLAPSLCAPRRPLPPCRPPGPAWLLSTVVAVGPPGPLGPQSSLDGGQRGRPGAQEE